MKRILCIAFFLLSTSFIYAEEYAFEGVHYVGSFKACNVDRLTDLKGLKEKMIEAARASGASVLDSVDFVFAPDGYTLVILLSESHASIHTYPEYGACFIDLFTCGTTCSSASFAAVLKEYLQPQDVNETTHYRN